MIPTEINSAINTQTTAPQDRPAWKRWVQPLAAPEHPWDRQSFVMIYASPTAGKSSFIEFLRSKDVTVWDTASFKLENGSPDMHAIIHALAGVSFPTPDVVVTGLPPSFFPYFYDMKFVRLEYEELASLPSQHVDSEDVSKGHMLDWVEMLIANSVMNGCIPLGKERFILDYLTTEVWE